MRTDVDRDLAVDVLVIGAGLLGLRIAGALHPHLSVCVVSEPGVRYESYDAAGRFAAGYDGDDVARIQPARRVAGYWRTWAASHGIPHDPAPSLHGLRVEEEAARTQLWAAAGLGFTPLAPGAVPPVLARGLLGRRSIYATPDDVVIDPGRVAAELRSGLDGSVVAAAVQRFRLITPQAVDTVELLLPDGTTVPVAPRFVVLAADAGNASLLLKLAGGMRDRARRRAVVETARTAQAVRRRPTVAVRGDLPLVAVATDGLDVTALPARSGDEHDVVWLVRLPVDDGDTVVGPDDLRFAPPFEPKVLTEGLDRLFELCPDVRRRAATLRWGAYVARQTEHAMVVSGGPARAPGPSPARLETMGMDALVAAWPSQPGYALVLGDVVVERIRTELGGPAPDTGERPADLPAPDPDTWRSRWDRSDFTWSDWQVFAGRGGIPG